MKEHIYTIVISEAMEADTECPLCHIEANMEQQALSYYLGAAMMEPSVRIETNEKGYCRNHGEKMLEMPNKLSLALSLQTRLETVLKTSTKHMNTDSCAVCDRVARQMQACTDNFLWLLKTEDTFRTAFIASKGLCVHHYAKLRSAIGRTDTKLSAALDAHMRTQLMQLQADIDRFAKKSDYRNSDMSWENAADAPQRGIRRLTH